MDGDDSLFIALYCFKAVCRRDSFGKGRGLHGCFRYPCPSMQSVSGVCSGCNMANADHMVCRSWRYIYHGAGRCQQQEVGCEREKSLWDNAKATLISQKKEYVELAKSIKKIVCSISGNDYIDYEDNLLENGLDSLLLSQISGRIVSDIQEAQGMRFDEILRASLTMPTIMGIAQYISDCKNPSKNQMHSNAGNQTRNSYTVVYIFGDNENEIRDVLIEKLSASNISCKRVGGQEIIERCHEDINVKKKYIIAFSEMASLCITKASELLGENIIINRIFLINPSKAKESDLYLGDISIIDGNSVAIKSWEKAVLGNVREFESNSNDIFDIIMRELENDK